MNTKSAGLIVNGNHTDIVITDYNNRTFLVVSQFNKLGSILLVSKEKPLDQFDGDVFATKTIFGKDEPEIQAAARFLTEKSKFDRPVLISICIKDFELETLRTIAEAIQQLKTS